MSTVDQLISRIEKIGGFSFYEIQKKIIRDDKKRFGIFLGTGVGKTLTAEVLAQGKVLVVCPKQQMVDRTWENNSEKFGLGKDLTVINYERFRRDWNILEKFDTLILDECHRALGVSPEVRYRNKVEIPKASQIFEAIYSYLHKHRPERMYLCSATPCPKPMNLWALSRLFGVQWDFYEFRSTFYIPVVKGMRTLWLAKKDSQTLDRLAANVKKFGYTGALKDFKDVPEQTHLTPENGGVHYIDLTQEQKDAIAKVREQVADPLVARGRIRTIENGLLYGKEVMEIDGKHDKMVKSSKSFSSNKIEYILDKALEFPKMLIFANYTQQIENIADALTEAGYTVRTVTGASKPEYRATVFTEAEKMDACILVVQSAICEGYRVPSVPCVIFASKSHQFVRYEQALGRVMDGQNIKKNIYIHLVVKGEADEACHRSIMSGSDFQELLTPQ